MYFLIGIWGGPRREYAAIKFLLYTLFGSVFILVAILILYFWQSHVGCAGFAGHSFDAVLLARIASETSYYPRSVQGWVFMLFFIGFIVKLPSFPFHTWLPDAHVEAPTPISMILAGILLKIGGYGLIRLAWPLAPAGAYDWSMWVAILGVFSILYGALVAMAQTDFKKLVAYSSVSHMGYVTLGMAVMAIFAADGTAIDPRYYAYGVNGAMYMMLAHGITSAGMFFLVGVIYDRAHTRDLNKLGGLGNIMPLYASDLVHHFLWLHGPSGPLRLRRRSVCRAVGVQLQSHTGDPGRGGGDLDCRLHSVDCPARLPGQERGLERPARPESARNRDRRSARRTDHRDGDIPTAARAELDEPVRRPDGSIGDHGKGNQRSSTSSQIRQPVTAEAQCRILRKRLDCL